MANSVNKVILIGNLGKDAETKFTTGGTAVTSFSMATTRKWKQGDEWKEQADWHNVKIWRAEKLAEYLTRGKQVYVEGRLEARSYEKDGRKHYVTEVVAESIVLLGGGGGESRQERSAPAPADEDVPF